MDDERPRPRPVGTPVLRISPSRAELVRYFAWGYLSRRELTDRLRRSGPRHRRARAQQEVSPAA